MKKIITLLIVGIVSITILLNYKNIIYNDYQQDFIYVYNKVFDNYPFIYHEDEEKFKNNKKIYLGKIRECRNEEEFIKEINQFLYTLNSPHTRLNNRHDSYYLYKTYKDICNENLEYKKFFEYLFNEFEKEEVISKYAEIEKYGTKEDSSALFKSSKDNFTYFTLLKDQVGYINIENLSYYNVETDKYKVEKCLSLFKNYKAIIVDLRNNLGGDSDYFSKMFLPMLVKDKFEVEFYSLIRDKTPETIILNNIEKIDESNEIKKIIESKFAENANYILDKYKFFTKSSVQVEESKDSIRYDGNIYFLINENTSSSAAYFTAVVKDGKIGTIIGMPTSPESMGNDPSMYILPKSKLMLRINTQLAISENLDFKKKGKITNGSISPDIEVHSNLSNKLNENNIKSDLCIKIILGLENESN
ncbi:MAG: S41 family peptidase [Peptoniphilaceae bacterium]